MPDTRNAAVERLLRWLVGKAAELMVDARRWEIVIAGKGEHYTCKVSVYEDP